ncbi:MAG: hypothetical protein FWG45_05910 [Oscillospiraceae bacterium]|nr:hypothetical protein [Oscillospiraceae bacterium]
MVSRPREWCRPLSAFSLLFATAHTVVTRSSLTTLLPLLLAMLPRYSYRLSYVPHTAYEFPLILHFNSVTPLFKLIHIYELAYYEHGDIYCLGSEYYLILSAFGGGDIIRRQ